MAAVAATPEYVSSSGVLSANIVLPILAIIAVVLRLIARRTKKQYLLSDDYTIIFALILCCGICSVSIYGASTRMYGKLLSKMTKPEFVKFRKILFYDIFFSYFAYGVVKVSVILFYKRIFSASKSLVLGANIMLALCVSFTITACLGQLLSSHPVSNRWLSKTTWGADIDYPAFMVAMGAIDILLDLLVLALPVPIVVKLHVNRNKKIQILAIFALGGFCVVSTSVRLYYIHKLLYILTLAPVPRTETSNLNIIWGHTEACASVIAACLPTLGPMFRDGRSLQSLFNSARSAFSISSRASQKNKSDGQSDVDSTKRTWEQINPTKSDASAESQDSRRGDLEAQTHKINGIVVEKSLAQEETVHR